MEFRVLGPLVMRMGGVSLVPSPPKTRQLLALLLLNADSPVSCDTCVDELWETGPPRSAVQSIHTRVFHIRKALASAPEVGSPAAARRILRTEHNGYSLQLPPGALDLHELEDRMQEVQSARAHHDDRQLAAALRGLLSLWRGRELADVPTGPHLRAHLVGIAARRLTLLEQCIEAELRLGLHHMLLPELETLAARYPVHENLHAQYMIALHRSGRTAQALETYQDLRRTLNSELGMEPSARLRRIHSAVLADSPDLECPPHTSAKLSLDVVTS